MGELRRGTSTHTEPFRPWSAAPLCRGHDAGVRRRAARVEIGPVLRLVGGPYAPALGPKLWDRFAEAILREFYEEFAALCLEHGELLADALFAQGVNQVVWHGMPFNGPGGRNEFYASVHVGPDAAFAAELPAFNTYLERVSALLKLGRTESRLAVYLPNEDNRRLDRIPDADRTPGAGYRWEMRHVVVPREAEGYAPLWISPAFLSREEVEGGRLRVCDWTFLGLLIDVGWLD